MMAAGIGENAASAARRVLNLERAFLTQAVDFMLDRGIRQFLDLGCGLPGAGSPHEMGGLAGRAVRVVHVDHDPGVVERAKRVIADTEHRYLLCHDVTDVPGVIGMARMTGMLDLRHPVGVVAVGLLHLVPVVDRLLPRYSEELALDSVFAASHLTRRFEGGEAAELIGGPTYPREPREITAMFDGLPLLKPGVVALPHEWGKPVRGTAAAAGVVAGIAVKREPLGPAQMAPARIA
ncbi:SAM-dependent methyltransferase [Lentzea sp. NPDC058450]|uniref:SAM-dependent methyltransferase n=1 Tax=Lentzea sp. NPDC058450 TaxID=3346505 RepID=UPI00365ACD04